MQQKFNLPEKNLEYVSGDLSWHGDIKGNQTQQIQIVVRAKENAKNGSYARVSGSAISYFEAGYWGGTKSNSICILNSPEESCICVVNVGEEYCAEEVTNETATQQLTTRT